MTTEAINQAMAELDASDLGHDYTEDLNAVARVVQRLGIYQMHEYWGRLAGIGPFECLDATAIQRCEAILRACGKWVEG